MLICYCFSFCPISYECYGKLHAVLAADIRTGRWLWGLPSNWPVITLWLTPSPLPNFPGRIANRWPMTPACRPNELSLMDVTCSFPPGRPLTAHAFVRLFRRHRKGLVPNLETEGRAISVMPQAVAWPVVAFHLLPLTWLQGSALSVTCAHTWPRLISGRFLSWEGHSVSQQSSG